MTVRLRIWFQAQVRFFILLLSCTAILEFSQSGSVFAVERIKSIALMPQQGSDSIRFYFNLGGSRLLMTNGAGQWIAFEYDKHRGHDYPYSSQFFDGTKTNSERILGDYLKSGLFEEDVYVVDLPLANPEVRAYWDSNLHSVTTRKEEVTYAQIESPDKFIESFSEPQYQISIHPKTIKQRIVSIGIAAGMFLGPMAIGMLGPVGLMEFSRWSRYNGGPLPDLFLPRNFREQCLGWACGMAGMMGSSYLLLRVMRRESNFLTEDPRLHIRMLRGGVAMGIVTGSLTAGLAGCAAVIKLLGLPPL